MKQQEILLDAIDMIRVQMQISPDAIDIPRFYEIIEKELQTIERAARNLPVGNQKGSDVQIGDYFELDGKIYQLENMEDARWYYEKESKWYLNHIWNLSPKYKSRKQVEDNWKKIQINLPVDNSWADEDMINFGFDTYCYISGIMGVEFSKISENKYHSKTNLQQYKLTHSPDTQK